MISLNCVNILTHVGIGLLFITGVTNFYAADPQLTIAKINSSVIKTFIAACPDSLLKLQPLSEITKQLLTPDSWLGINQKMCTAVAAKNLEKSFNTYKTIPKKVATQTMINGQEAKAMIMDDQLFTQIKLEEVLNEFSGKFSIVANDVKFKILEPQNLQDTIRKIFSQMTKIDEYTSDSANQPNLPKQLPEDSSSLPLQFIQLTNKAASLIASAQSDAIKQLMKLSLKIDLNMTNKDELARALQKSALECKNSQPSRFLPFALLAANFATKNTDYVLFNLITTDVDCKLLTIINQLKSHFGIEVKDAEKAQIKDVHLALSQRVNQLKKQYSEELDNLAISNAMVLDTTFSERKNAYLNAVQAFAKLLVVDIINNSQLAAQKPLFKVGLSKSFEGFEPVVYENTRIVIRSESLDYMPSAKKVSQCAAELSDLCSTDSDIIANLPTASNPDTTNITLPRSVDVSADLLEQTLKTTLEQDTSTITAVKITYKEAKCVDVSSSYVPAQEQSVDTSQKYITPLHLRQSVVCKVADTFGGSRFLNGPKVRKNFYEAIEPTKFEVTVLDQTTNQTETHSIESVSKFILAMQGALTAADDHLVPDITKLIIEHNQHLFFLVNGGYLTPDLSFLFEREFSQLDDKQKAVTKKVPTIDSNLFGSFTSGIRQKYTKSDAANPHKKIQNFCLKRSSRNETKLKKVVPTIAVVEAGAKVISNPKMSAVLKDLCQKGKLEQLQTSLYQLVAAGTHKSKEVKLVGDSLEEVVDFKELEPFYKVLDEIYCQQFNIPSKTRTGTHADFKNPHIQDYDPNSFFQKFYKLVLWGVPPFLVFVYIYKRRINSKLLAASNAPAVKTSRSIVNRLFNVATLNTFNKRPKLVTYFEALKRSPYILYTGALIFTGAIKFSAQTGLSYMSIFVEQMKSEHIFKTTAASTISTALSIQKKITYELGLGRLPSGLTTDQGCFAVLNPQIACDIKRAAKPYCDPLCPEVVDVISFAKK